MTTIYNLATDWWDGLPITEKQKLYPQLVFENTDIVQNLFYQEVIVKWYESTYNTSLFQYPTEEIKEIYLKEHTKDTSITCRICGGIGKPSKGLVNYHNLQHQLAPYTTTEFKDKFEDCLKCENCGHSWINGEEHTKEEKETIKSVTNCPTCGSECTIGGDSTTHFYIPKTSHPKEVVDVWDKFAKEYSQLHSLDLEQVRYWFIPLIEFGKQHYTLIKKQ